MKKLTIILVVLILVAATILGTLYVRQGFKKPSGGSANISGDILDISSDVDNSEEYLTLITQYSKQVNELKSEIEVLKADKDKQLAEKNAEIASLEEELANSQNQDADIIASKNARISALKEVILTLEEETAEAVESYEARITALNESLSIYEGEVIKSITLPTNFVFTKLGFEVLDNDNFIFYSKSHSCNLYYYNYETKTLTTLPIKGSSFNYFYKNSNLLFFAADSSLYVYNFETTSLTLLSSFVNVKGSYKPSLAYVLYDNNVYIFDYYGGYSIYNIATGEFQYHFVISDGFKADEGVTTVICNNYILHTGYNSQLKLYNNETNSDYLLLTGVNSVFSFFKLNNQYLFVCNKGLYALDINNYTCSQIKSFSSSFCYYYDLDNSVALYTSKGLFIYDGQNFSSLSSSGNYSYKFTFFKVQDGIYYFSSDGDPTFKYLHKLDTSSNIVTTLSTSYSSLHVIEKIGHYYFLFMANGLYVVDLDNGSFEALKAGYYSRDFFKFELDKYILLGTINRDTNSSTYIIYYDKINDCYGFLLSNFSKIYDVAVKNNLFYVMTTETLYVFDLNVSLTNYISTMSIDASISNLDKGIFYQKVGEISEGVIYVRLYLQSDGTFKKEFVVTKNK